MSADPEALADKLEKQARWLTRVSAAQGLVMGGVLGWLIAYYFNLAPPASAAIFAVLGAFFGFGQGQSRQAALQIEAAQIRTLAKIERNTRGEA